MTRLALLVVAALLGGGCVQPTEPQYEIDFSGDVDDERPDPTFGHVATGPAVGPDLNATTRAAPRLVEGEWWRIRNSGGVAEQIEEFVRVVANATPEGYVVGMPHEGWFKEAIIQHSPALGDVGLNLSYPVHNLLFEPVRFPLEKGATWTTHFAGAYRATVVAADTYTAEIRLHPLQDQSDPTAVVAGYIFPSIADIVVSYDARVHEIVKMDMGIGSWEVIGHGYGFEGWVTVPRGEETVIDYATLGPAAPGQPVLKRSLRVEGGFNRLTMLQAVFAETRGAYHIFSTPPADPPMRLESDGTRSFTIQVTEANHPDGIWEQEDLAAGVGGTYSMGIAYHQYDIRLPDGSRRADHAHPVIR